MNACPLCNRADRDRAGAVKHEPWCPHFLRGPDAGGDPAEWPTLLDELADRIEAGELIAGKSISDRDFLAPLLDDEARPSS